MEQFHVNNYNICLLLRIYRAVRQTTLSWAPRNKTHFQWLTIHLTGQTSSSIILMGHTELNRDSNVTFYLQWSTVYMQSWFAKAFKKRVHVKRGTSPHWGIRGSQVIPLEPRGADFRCDQPTGVTESSVFMPDHQLWTTLPPRTRTPNLNPAPTLVKYWNSMPHTAAGICIQAYICPGKNNPFKYLCRQ